MISHSWRRAIESRPRTILTIIAIAAVTFRAIVWQLFEGPIIRGDARSYMAWAQAIAAGDLSGFSDYPLHQLYPVLIAPAFVAGLPVAAYLFVLQTALSLATVSLVYRAARHFTDFTAACAAASLAAGYPSLLFWYPYILSETAFFFFVALFTAALISVLRQTTGPSARSLILLAVAAVLLLFARPASIAVLAAGLPAALYVFLLPRLGRHRARRTVFAMVVTGVALLVVFFSLDTPQRRAVLRNPTIAQSFWLSTKLSSSSLSEWLPIAAESQAISERFTGRLEEAWDLKVQQASAFVRENPGDYLMLALRRCFSFWMLGAFSDGWSTKHRAFDVVLILGLFLGAFLSLMRNRDLIRVVLLAICLSLGFLTSFSQIDSDGRYRAPAELGLILLAADGFIGHRRKAAPAA